MLKPNQGFQKGNKLGGRRRKEWEEKQIQAMRIEVDWWLRLAKKIRQRTAKKSEVKAFKMLEKAKKNVCKRL